jgi:hypothetical protein
MLMGRSQERVSKRCVLAAHQLGHRRRSLVAVEPSEPVPHLHVAKPADGVAALELRDHVQRRLAVNQAGVDLVRDPPRICGVHDGYLSRLACRVLTAGLREARVLRDPVLLAGEALQRPEGAGDLLADRVALRRRWGSFDDSSRPLVVSHYATAAFAELL